MSGAGAIVIAIYASGFGFAIVLDFYDPWRLITRDVALRRSPGDVPDRLEAPSGPDRAASVLIRRRR
ncbi:MAG: hypothetical protein V3R98_11100 [Alphaproteobacteria bacterium]